MYTLYLKEHNKTGLKYLGYTKLEDVHKYQGSGMYWKRHIKEHGYDVTTKILGKYSTQEELKLVGLYYTQLYGIVESKEFANLKEEAGVSGKYSLETKMKMSESAIKRVKEIGAPAKAFTKESASALNKKTWADPKIRKKRSESISKALKGKKRDPRSQEFKDHMSKTLTGRSYGVGIKHNLVEKTCSYCNVTGKGPNMTRYHFDNCKSNPFGDASTE
jgi:hypothetical protein